MGIKAAPNNGHRWTTEELQQLIGAWLAGDDISVIAAAFNCTTRAINTQVGRMRRDGIPLPRRNAGHQAGRSNKPWTQSEVEFLIRRRDDKATAEQIAAELDRTFLAVQGMIAKLRKEQVPIRLLGQGVRRLWNADALRAACTGRGLSIVAGTDLNKVA